MVLDMCTECTFTQVVQFQQDKPTYLTYILFTNRPLLVQTCKPLPGISNHDTILANVNLEVTYQEQPIHNIYLWN